jgi:hypothetical protein
VAAVPKLNHYSYKLSLLLVYLGSFLVITERRNFEKAEVNRKRKSLIAQSESLHSTSHSN